MQSTFYTFSFGCRVNEAEKIALDKKLLDMGCVWQEINPDFYIINSCAVTGKAEREVRQHIYQIRKKYPKTKIIVTGCAATNWIKNKNNVKGVDFLISNSEKQGIPSFIYKLSCHSGQRAGILHLRSRVPTSPPAGGFDGRGKPGMTINIFQHDNVHDKFLASGRIMVKIQDGCDRFCSYCIVPYLRGKPKSIRIADIIETINTYPSSEGRYRTVSDEARSMKTMHSSHPSGSNNKLNEVILTAINTECFGKDTGETLIQLIDAVLKETLIPKISFGSIHPWSITNEFLAYYQSIIPTNRFIPFFHIPIQSGSNKILQLMNRGYAVEDIYRKLKEIKRINPKAFIGTDIIVGFPGETEKEFQETYEFLKSAPIDKIHVFRFSPRPGTAAEKFGKIYGEPTAEEKRKRSKMILNINTNK